MEFGTAEKVDQGDCNIIFIVTSVTFARKVILCRRLFIRIKRFMNTSLDSLKNFKGDQGILEEK